jgi:hypothetical protein
MRTAGIIVSIIGIISVGIVTIGIRGSTQRGLLLLTS